MIPMNFVMYRMNLPCIIYVLSVACEPYKYHVITLHALIIGNKSLLEWKTFDTAGNLTVQHSYITTYINILVLLLMGGHTHTQIDYISVHKG